MRIGFHVKSRLASVSQVSTFRAQLQSMTFSRQDLVALVHVENIRFLKMMIDPNRKDLLEAIPELAQHRKSRLGITWTRVGLESRSILCRILDLDQQGS